MPPFKRVITDSQGNRWVCNLSRRWSYWLFRPFGLYRMKYEVYCLDDNNWDEEQYKEFLTKLVVGLVSSGIDVESWELEEIGVER